MNEKELQDEFCAYFKEKYGTKLLKTAWHFVTWWMLYKVGTPNKDRLHFRNDTLKAFHRWCESRKCGASWENCARYCASI